MFLKSKRGLLIIAICLTVTTTLILLINILASLSARKNSYAYFISKANEQLQTDDPSSHPHMIGPNLLNAADDFQRALAIRPSGYEAVDGLGGCYLSMSEDFSGKDKKFLIDLACSFLRKAVTQATDPYVKAFDLCRISQDDYLSGNLALARKEAEEAVHLAPVFASVLFDGKKLKRPNLEIETND